MALKSRKKGGWEPTDLVPPTLMRTAGFVRQDEWLELLLLVYCFDFILSSTLAVGRLFQRVEAHGESKEYLELLFTPVPFAGGRRCTFVSCNRVDVPVSLKMTIFLKYRWQPKRYYV